jgi:hypothetical protein
MKSGTEIIMMLLLSIVVLAMLYSVFILFPEKLKLIKKYGGHLTSADFIDMSKRGHEDVKDLVVKTKYVLVVLIVSGSSLVILKNHF